MVRKRDVADWIKVGAVATAIPRWVVALLASEGFTLPLTWLSWWVPLSAAMSAAMAIVEGFAFMYLFNKWGELRNSNGKVGRNLLILAGIAALSFIAVLMPSIAASVRGVTVGAMITADAALYLWSVAVAASTISIVVAVGYAQRAFPTEIKEPTAMEGEILPAIAHSSNGHSKKEKVQELANLYPEWTARQLAKEVGCTYKTAHNAMKEMRE